jgi:hypothetical protein
MSEEFKEEYFPMCFLDKERPCTPECVAYKLVREDGDSKDDWSHCRILSFMDLLNKNSRKLMSIADDFQRSRKRLPIIKND